MSKGKFEAWQLVSSCYSIGRDVAGKPYTPPTLDMYGYRSDVKCKPKTRLNDEDRQLAILGLHAKYPLDFVRNQDE